MNLIINHNKNEEEKEATLEGHCEPLSKNEISVLFSKEEAMCKIKINKIIDNKPGILRGSGFFLIHQNLLIYLHNLPHLLMENFD